jgi:hypothetical protein
MNYPAPFFAFNIMLILATHKLLFSRSEIYLV